jgi:hypothetical protein
VQSADGKTWTHPTLGAFTRAGKYGGDDDWEGTVILPKSTDKCDILFEEEEDSTSAPSSEAVSTMLAAFNDPKKIMQLVSSYLWDDFNGKIKGHMWWSNSLDAVRKNCNGASIKNATDVGKQMRLTTMTARANGDLVATFEAKFEEEHGVDALIVNGKVTDVAYQCGV